MVIPLFKVASRLDSRLIKKESERALPALAAIEAVFLEALFDNLYRPLEYVDRLRD